MIPLRDNIPHRRTPYAMYVILGLNVAMFFLQTNQIVDLYAVKPVYLRAFLGGETIADLRPVIQGGRLVWIHVGFIEPGFSSTVIPYFTSMFLHGGFMHLAGNMLYLWIFGNNIEGELGPIRFTIFYFVCGLLAGLCHTVVELGSYVPTIGASGAIAGVLGAYLVRFPKARVLTLIPIGFLFMVEVPAVILLGLWFLKDFFIGITGTAGNVAVWAHVGGFAAGALLFFLLDSHRKDRRAPSVPGALHLDTHRVWPGRRR